MLAKNPLCAKKINPWQIVITKVLAEFTICTLSLLKTQFYLMKEELNQFPDTFKVHTDEIEIETFG
jgi:hypothetical protein